MATKARRNVLALKKLTFYNENKNKIDTLASSDDNWRSKEVREFLELARKQVGYADTTAPCDIYSALLSLTPTYKQRRESWRKT
jgi:hypothetical protein